MVIKGKCDAFIIPNPGAKIENLICASEEGIKRLINLCKVNGTTIDPEKDTFIQLWFVGKEDFECDNMQDKCYTYEEDGTRYFFRIPYNRYPTKLFSGNEGDIIHVKFPDVPIIRERGYDDDDNIKCDVELDITLKQRCYRYASFGNYENVLRQ